MPNKATEASRLHGRNEPRLRSQTLYSMLDLMGAEMSCDRCGRWQRIPSLGFDAREKAEALGWRQIDGQDVCTVCQKQEIESGR